MLQNSCSNCIPSAAIEKILLRMARHKLKIGVDTAIQIYIALITVLVDHLPDEIVDADWDYPSRLQLQKQRGKSRTE